MSTYLWLEFRNQGAMAPVWMSSPMPPMVQGARVSPDQQHMPRFQQAQAPPNADHPPLQEQAGKFISNSNCFLILRMGNDS